MRPRRQPELQLLVCTHELGYGGAQLFLVELLRQMSSHAPIGGLVLAPRGGATQSALEAIGFDVHVSTEFPISSAEQYEGRIAELGAWAGSRRFDAALVNTMVAFPAADVASRIGLPIVWAIHESYSLPEYWATYGERLDPEVRERGTAALRNAAVAAFTCEATHELYAPSLPEVASEMLPYGIDVDGLDRWRQGFDRDRYRREDGIGEDDFVILCMGTIEPRKAQTQLVHAFAQIAEHHPNAQFVFVGSRGDHYARLASKAVALHGLEERVRIQPVVPDPRPLYASADLLVSASDLESTPRSILEAMALRLPVLSTDVFGVPELIDDGRSGWRFEPRDVDCAARALDRVLSLDARERSEVARQARLMVEREYRSDQCSRQWLDLLRRVAAGNGARSAVSAG